MDLISKIKVVYESNNILVVHKPSFLPTVPLKKDKEDKVTLLKVIRESYPKIAQVNGYNIWEDGVLHRLDTNTSGLVLIAKNQDCFDYLARSQKVGLFLKEYRAISNQNSQRIENFGDFPYEDVLSKNEVVVGSMFRYFGKGRSLVLPVLSSYSPNIVKKATGRWYSTSVRYEGKDNSNDIFICKLSAGFKHQVRSHLSWSNHPLIGDVRYGGIDCGEFGLQAISITFLNPENGEKITIKDNNF